MLFAKQKMSSNSSPIQAMPTVASGSSSLLEFLMEICRPKNSKGNRWFSLYYVLDWILAFVSVVVVELVFGAYFGGVCTEINFHC